MTAKKELAELQEQVRAAKYEEAQEMHRALLRTQHGSLDQMCAKAAAGDRESMLQLIEVTSETLHAFDLLSEELRGKLANGLNEIVKVLSQSPDFERGKLSTVKKRKEADIIFRTAFSVELLRYSEGMILDVARARIAATFEIGEDLVHKRWQRSHKEAKAVFAAVEAVSKALGSESPYSRTKKKVR